MIVKTGCYKDVTNQTTGISHFRCSSAPHTPVPAPGTVYYYHYYESETNKTFCLKGHLHLTSHVVSATMMQYSILLSSRYVCYLRGI